MYVFGFCCQRRVKQSKAKHNVCMALMCAELHSAKNYERIQVLCCSTSLTLPRKRCDKNIMDCSN